MTQSVPTATATPTLTRQSSVVSTGSNDSYINVETLSPNPPNPNTPTPHPTNPGHSPKPTVPPVKVITPGTPQGSPRAPPPTTPQTVVGSPVTAAAKPSPMGRGVMGSTLVVSSGGAVTVSAATPAVAAANPLSVTPTTPVSMVTNPVTVSLVPQSTTNLHLQGKPRTMLIRSAGDSVKSPRIVSAQRPTPHPGAGLTPSQQTVQVQLPMSAGSSLGGAPTVLSQLVQSAGTGGAAQQQAQQVVDLGRLLAAQGALQKGDGGLGQAVKIQGMIL